MSRFLNERTVALRAYVPGEQPRDKKYVKLNTNESPFSPSAKARRLAKKQLRNCRLYPDPDCKELLSAIALNADMGIENVIVGNGSDEILNFAFIAYCSKTAPAVFPDITYGFYKVFADVNGVPKKEIPLREDFTVDISEYEQTDGVIFLANPNAPTGLALSVGEIERLLAENPQRVVVVDEAYVDFGGESCVPLVKKYDNLLVTQTFSKSRAMAGARLGFGIAGKGIIEDLNRIKYSTNPYNVNRVTAAAGTGSMRDKAYFESCCKKVVQTREWTSSRLKEMGFTMTESLANFLFVKHEKIGGEQLYQALKSRGVLVRHFAQERIKDYVRITVGSRKQMQILVKSIGEILCER